MHSCFWIIRSDNQVISIADKARKWNWPAMSFRIKSTSMKLFCLNKPFLCNYFVWTSLETGLASCKSYQTIKCYRLTVHLFNHFNTCCWTNYQIKYHFNCLKIFPTHSNWPQKVNYVKILSVSRVISFICRHTTPFNFMGLVMVLKNIQRQVQ